MKIKIKVPFLPESVENAVVAHWHKKKGDFVKKNENLVDLETDKVILEVPSPEDGILENILKKKNDVVNENEELGSILKKKEQELKKSPNPIEKKSPEKKINPIEKKSPEKKINPIEKNNNNPIEIEKKSNTQNSYNSSNNDIFESLSPSQREKYILNQDIENTKIDNNIKNSGRNIIKVPITRIRQKIADRLLYTKNSTAMLTTFNEIIMDPIINIRNLYKKKFEEEHNIKLGFMSFFVKAAVQALKLFPDVNAYFDNNNNNIIYHEYFDISIAIASKRGLFVPVIRNAENLGLHKIEKSIVDFANKAKNNKITIEDMSGGTFTITNGGIFGSMLSTPIINPPQSAILGMHNIQKRPVVENDIIKIRSVMYLALSYDHRIIDGKDAVSFLKKIKEFIEDPIRLLLDI